MNQQSYQPMGGQRPSTVRPWLLIILIIVILAGAGFFWYYYFGPGKSSGTTTPTTTTKTDETADWKTYTNKTYGYSIKYPTSLTETDVDTKTAQFKETAKPNDPAVLEIDTDAVTDAAKTLDQVVQARASQFTEGAKTTLAGIAAKEGIEHGIINYYSIITVNNSNVYRLVFNTNKADSFASLKSGLSDTQKTMLSTFKFTTASTSTTTSAVAPEKVAENFYTYYLGLVNPGGQTNSQAKFQSTTKPYKLKTGFSDYLTATLISSLEDLYNDPATNSDVILCAQDIPTKITYDTAKINGDTATTVANMQFSAIKKVTLGYVKENNNWKINTITCP